MIITRVFRWLIVTSFFGIGSTTAQEITPTPGMYELLEGKSMQFDAQQKDGKVLANRYEWQVVYGEGAKLLNANSARVTFVAPSGLNDDTRNFTLQLTTYYPTRNKPSEAQISIRVHKKANNMGARERSPWLYGTVGFGFGYLWGGWWPYPPLIVIPPPPPGEIWRPEDVTPVAVPLPEDPSFASWIEKNPGVAAAYLNETEMKFDSPADEAPTTDLAPAVTIEPAVTPEPMDSMGTMDTPEPIDIPMDLPMDFGDF